VRTLLVELLPKPIELPLLGSQATGRRDGGFLLEGTVHALVHPVLVRLAWLDQFRENAQLENPHRQLLQTRQGVGGKRHPYRY
jgi:hypothetical protein